MRIEFPSLEEVDQMEERDLLDAANGLVIKKFQENNSKDIIEVTADDIRNAAAVEELNEKDIESIKEFFERKKIGVSVSGNSGEECFQFTMPPEKAI